MRARAAAAIALSGVLALGLAGCNFVTFPGTTDPYDPSDGINFSVGDLQLRNMLVITEDGETGSLLATAVNTTGADIDFTVQWQTDGTWHEVDLVAASGGRTDFGFGDGERVNLDDLGVLPGDLLDVVVHADGTQKGEQVPVLDNTTFPEYADFLPTPTPTPEPAETETTGPTETTAP